MVSNTLDGYRPSVKEAVPVSARTAATRRRARREARGHAHDAGASVRPASGPTCSPCHNVRESLSREWLVGARRHQQWVGRADPSACCYSSVAAVATQRAAPDCNEGDDPAKRGGVNRRMDPSRRSRAAVPWITSLVVNRGSHVGLYAPRFDSPCSELELTVGKCWSPFSRLMLEPGQLDLRLPIKPLVLMRRIGLGLPGSGPLRDRSVVFGFSRGAGAG